MLYKKQRFSVPATNQAGDCSTGHAMPDTKGKCIRCGEPTGLMAFAGDGPPQWGAVIERDEVSQPRKRNCLLHEHFTSGCNTCECIDRFAMSWTEAQSGSRAQRFLSAPGDGR